MIPAGVRIFVCTEPVDMRRGFDRRGFTSISGESVLVEIRASFRVVGSQRRAPLEGFANAARRVRIPPCPRFGR
jgi:hypothetical protein